MVATAQFFRVVIEKAAHTVKGHLLQALVRVTQQTVG